MNSRSSELQMQVERAERQTLTDLSVEARLRSATKTQEGLGRFAEAFYFCRVGFVRANFILGARCPYDERYWVGLARNLWEEAGGGATPPHNALYRRFLESTTARPEAELDAPAFTAAFNDAWDDLAAHAPLVDALVAFAAYEALDAPDYQMLLRALEPNVTNADALEFFRVHTEVRHVELFDDAIRLIPAADDFALAVDRQCAFVVSHQRQLWRGLLDHIEAAGADQGVPVTTER